MWLADLYAVDTLGMELGPEDDPGAVAWADALLRREVARYEPRDLHLVTIDGWFSRRWLSFSHKGLGAVGVHHRRHLRVPPFTPSRVVTQRSFVRERGGAYYLVPRSPALHVRQTSEANARRVVTALHPGAALFWWSSGTRASGRGSLMAYLPGEDEHLGWYAEVARDASGAWRLAHSQGIGAAELAAGLALAEAHARHDPA